jgi:hypothetical protein
MLWYQIFIAINSLLLRDGRRATIHVRLLMAARKHIFAVDICSCFVLIVGAGIQRGTARAEANL